MQFQKALDNVSIIIEKRGLRVACAGPPAPDQSAGHVHLVHDEVGRSLCALEQAARPRARRYRLPLNAASEAADHQSVPAGQPLVVESRADALRSGLAELLPQPINGPWLINRAISNRQVENVGSIQLAGRLLAIIALVLNVI